MNNTTNTKPRRVAVAHLRMLAIETDQRLRWGQRAGFWNGQRGEALRAVASGADALRWATPAEASAFRESEGLPSGFRLRWADCSKSAQARRKAEGWNERTGEQVQS